MAGARGVVTRMLDKQMRLLSLTDEGFEQQVQNESLMDTAMDMINYATYLVSLLDGSWGQDPDFEIVEKTQGEKAIFACQQACDYFRANSLNMIECGSEIHKLLQYAIEPELPF